MKTKVKPEYLQRVDGADHFIANMKSMLRSHVYYNEVIPQDELEREYRERSNIYMLCTRKRVRFAKNSIRVKADDKGVETIGGLLEVRGENGTTQVPFEADLEKIGREVLENTRIGLPNIREAHVTVRETADNSILRATVTGTLNDGRPFERSEDMELDRFSRYFTWYVEEVQDLLIEYIGKSTGTIHESNSPKRLENHDQRTVLLGEAAKSGAMDVISLYLDYDLVRVDRAHVSTPIDMPRPNMVSLIEGALINHFLPRLNEEEKERYPHKRPLQKQVTQIGMNTMNVTVNGDDCTCRLYTAKIPKTEFAVTSHRYDDNGVGHADRSNADVSCFPFNPQTVAKQLHFLEAKSEEVRFKSEILLGMRGPKLGIFDRIMHWARPAKSASVRSSLGPVVGLNEDTEAVLSDLKDTVAPALQICVESIRSAFNGGKYDAGKLDAARSFLYGINHAMASRHEDASRLLRIAIQDHFRETGVTLTERELKLMPVVVQDAWSPALLRKNGDAYFRSVSNTFPDDNLRISVNQRCIALKEAWAAAPVQSYYSISPSPRECRPQSERITESVLDGASPKIAASAPMKPRM